MAKFVIYPVPMPNVVGDAQQVAIDAVTNLEVSYVLVTINSPSVAAGVVIDQDPIAGADVAEDAIVTLTVSLGSVQIVGFGGGIILVTKRRHSRNRKRRKLRKAKYQ